MTLPMDDFLPDRRPSNIIYLSIYEGMLCQRRATETPGFARYESKSPKTKGKVSWVREFDHINGFITGFERKEKETLAKDKFYVAQITFNHPETTQRAILEVPIKSEFVARFASCVENMDLKKPVWMRSFLDKTGHTAVMFKQEDAKVEQKYTQEHPNGLPAWEKDPITDEWDTREYWKFLFQIIADKALPVIKDVKAALDGIRDDDQGTPPTEAAFVAEVEVTTTDNDDIPF